MFIPCGSLLGVGSEDAALYKALASIPQAGFTPPSYFGRPIRSEKEIVLKPGKLRESASLPQPHSGNSQGPLEDITLEKQQGTRAD